MHPRAPAVLRHLAADAVPDADLLARFTAGRDPAAFELLVWRHAGMVLRVCRGVTGDHHAAEDACQATFLALARRAAAVGRGSVAGWLYRVARRTAARAARRAGPAAGPPDLLDQVPAPDPPAGPDPALVRALHDEVAGLPERYRVPVLLCFFEGLTHRAAADRLGVPVGTLAARVARAKDRLRRRLSARGLGASAGGLVAALTAGSVVATPGFVAATSGAAVAFAAGVVPGLPENVLELAEGATRTMTAATIRFGVGVLGVCAALALGGLWVAGGQEPPKPPPAGGKADPAAGPGFGFHRMALDADDLADALGLNVYVFRVEVPRGQRFRVVLREQEGKDAAPRELTAFAFRKGDDDAAVMMRVDFTRLDGVAGGVLLTEQKEAGIRVNCKWCSPGGVASVVRVPLSGLKPTERMLVVHKSDRDDQPAGGRETRLLTVARNTNEAGPGKTSFPRAELVVVKE